MRIIKTVFLFSTFVVVLASLFLTTKPAHAAPLDNFPVTVTQPDGTELNLFVSGDEFYNWLHDAQGYTIIQDPDTGYYVYADLVNGELVPTQYVVGKAEPATTGLRPYLNITPEKREEIRQEALEQGRQAPRAVASAPHSGTINNLVIFIRFSGESEFTDTPSTYTNMLTDSTPGANSLRNYYQEVSYNTLTIDSTLLPTPGATVVSYQDSHARGYFQPYNATTNPNGYQGGDNGSERRLREHALLRDAITYISGLGQFPSGASLDGDGDGYVDSLTFVISGSPTGWSSLLWPHQWDLYSYTVKINGKTVAEYAFQLQNSLVYSGTGVLAHEMFHVLGAPDLYHYTYDGMVPVGGWDVMEADQNPPQHMGCFMKFKYGDWIASIPEITAAGTYSLHPLTSSTNNCYKIASPYSTTEYFLVEYRRRETGSTFEASLPGTGLLVYRINTQAIGNAYGPPDEVYIYRPGGTTTTNGNVNAANFSSDVGRTAVNDATDPSSFLSNGSAGGLRICNVGASGSTISFDYGSICPITGYIISGNAGVGGVTLNYMDGTPKTTTADNSGLYSFTVPPGWSGTVTPSKAGYIFKPSSRSYTNVLANQTAQGYTATGPTNLLQDPGFETFTPGAADPNPYWVETSTNFGTPLCATGYCSTGGGTTGPNTGSVWGWFGGTSSDETATLSQTVTIPSGTADLDFYLWIGSASTGSGTDDVFTAQIDGVTVFSADATQIGSYPDYTLVSVDVSAFADDAAHTVTFSSATTGQVVSFNLDDVSLVVDVSVPSPTNDDFDTPQIVSETPFYASADTRGATSAADDPPLTACNRAPGQASVWYRYTAQANGDLLLDTIGSNYDTMLAVWTGPRGSLISVGCNDDSGAVHTSILSAPVTKGTVYTIEVSQYNGTLNPASPEGAKSIEDPALAAGGQLEFHLALQTTPLRWGLHQETDPGIEYNGTWMSYSGSGPSGGSLMRTNQQNASVVLRYIGSAVTIYRTLGSDRGTMEVCVDGSCQTVNNHAATLQWAQPVTFTGEGSYGLHEVEITNISTAIVDLDAVEVLDWETPINPRSLSSSHVVGIPSGDSTIDMTWSSDATDPGGAGIAGYSVVFDNSASTTPDEVVDVVAGIHTQTSALLADGTWYFHLRTCDNAGNCAAAIHTGPYLIDAVPELISPVDGSTIADNTPTFDWGDVTGTTQYQIQVDNNVDFSSPVIDTTTTVSTYTPTAALANGVYHWHVRARSGSNWNAYSSARTVTIAASPPGAATLATPIGGATVTSAPVAYQWNAVTCLGGVPRRHLLGHTLAELHQRELQLVGADLERQWLRPLEQQRNIHLLSASPRRGNTDLASKWVDGDKYPGDLSVG
jgi:M6 family metalloprotease-like protein